jgi:hypothetical protein
MVFLTWLFHFNQDFAQVPKQTQNTYLRLASTFHGLHAIAGNLSPVPIEGGIDSIQTEHFRLQSYLTLTGTLHRPPRFMLISVTCTIFRSDDNVSGFCV